MENLTFFKGLESSFFFTLPSLKEREGLDKTFTNPPHSRREGWDKTFTSFQFHSPSQGERGMGRLSHILFPHVFSLDKVNLTF